MKIDRLISIIIVLLNNEKISATKLAKLFEVSPRTIYRDIETISAAGIPIITTTGINGGIGIMAQYKVDKKYFNSSELKTLLIGLDSLTPVFSQKELTGALAKLKNLLSVTKELDKNNNIKIDLQQWRENKGVKDIFNNIKLASEESKYIEFDYYNKEGDKNNRRVEPYQLTLKNGSWYLKGYCLIRKDFRIFKLSRMINFKVLQKEFIPREYSTEFLFGKRNKSKKIFEIKLLVDISLIGEMIELCGRDKVKIIDENKLLVDFPFMDDNYSYNILLGFGLKCECLSPQKVRYELKNRLIRLLEIYNS